jgi:hypothetical protein
MTMSIPVHVCTTLPLIPLCFNQYSAADMGALYVIFVLFGISTAPMSTALQAMNIVVMFGAFFATVVGPGLVVPLAVVFSPAAAVYGIIPIALDRTVTLAVSPAVCILLLVLQCVVYSLIAEYVEVGNWLGPCKWLAKRLSGSPGDSPAAMEDGEYGIVIEASRSISRRTRPSWTASTLKSAAARSSRSSATTGPGRVR